MRIGGRKLSLMGMPDLDKLSFRLLLPPALQRKHPLRVLVLLLLLLLGLSGCSVLGSGDPLSPSTFSDRNWVSLGSEGGEPKEDVSEHNGARVPTIVAGELLHDTPTISSAHVTEETPVIRRTSSGSLWTPWSFITRRDLSVAAMTIVAVALVTLLFRTKEAWSLKGEENRLHAATIAAASQNGGFDGVGYTGGPNEAVEGTPGATVMQRRPSSTDPAAVAATVAYGSPRGAVIPLQELRTQLHRTASLLPAAERLAAVVDSIEASTLFHETQQLVEKVKVGAEALLQVSPRPVTPQGNKAPLDQQQLLQQQQQQFLDAQALQTGLRAAGSSLQQLLAAAEERAWALLQQALPLQRPEPVAAAAFTQFWGKSGRNLLEAVELHLQSLAEATQEENKRAHRAYRELVRLQEHQANEGSSSSISSAGSSSCISIKTVVGTRRYLETIYAACIRRQRAAQLASRLGDSLLSGLKAAALGNAANSQRLMESLIRMHDTTLQLLLTDKANTSTQYTQAGAASALPPPTTAAASEEQQQVQQEKRQHQDQELERLKDELLQEGFGLKLEALLQEHKTTRLALEDSDSMAAAAAACEQLYRLGEQAKTEALGFHMRLQAVPELSHLLQGGLPLLLQPHLKNIRAAAQQSLDSYNAAEGLYTKLHSRMQQELQNPSLERENPAAAVLLPQMLDRLQVERRRAAEGAAAAKGYFEAAAHAPDTTALLKAEDAANAAAVKASRGAARTILVFLEYSTLCSLNLFLKDSLELWALRVSQADASSLSTRPCFDELKRQFEDWEIAAEDVRDLPAAAAAAAEARNLFYRLQHLTDTQDTAGNNP
ncbi:hypothetical protein, conserved [Eimeria maxima]|uniref:Uncharacterized protein n=1 Tax=Eimeria maxima TaxID=5804 RepID=U6M3M8_EIMMA|nr:hypothetical protein, conserved [Eimeria maxima]CDJ58611.1 hypothetical protein, conserved [Eimeria maxima]